MRTFEGTAECRDHGKFDWLVDVLVGTEYVSNLRNLNVLNTERLSDGKISIEPKCPDCNKRVDTVIREL